jgi:hypothetical protein
MRWSRHLQDVKRSYVAHSIQNVKTQTNSRFTGYG